MGNPKMPVDLLVYKGKKHLTKKEIEERKETEVKAKSDKVKAPSYLSSSQKKEFNKISKELKDIGIITNLDVDSLARLVQLQELYLKVMEEIQVLSPLDESFETLLKHQDKLFKNLRSSAKDMGLTIVDRCRIAIPKKDDEKPKSDVEKRFGDRL